MADNGTTFDQMMMSYLQQLNQSGGTTSAPVSGGQDLASAGKTVGQVGGTIGGLVSMVPGYGTIIGGAISGASAIASGIMESVAANKQSQQAASDLAAARYMKAPPLPPELRQKLQMDKMAALSDMPGWTQYHDLLASDFATHLRAIHNESRNGAQALGAIATSLGLNNDAMTKLFASDEAYKSKARETVSKDLWDIGLMQHQNEQEFFQNYQKPLYQQATALQNAATANKMTGINTITGAVGSVASSIGGSIDKRAALNDVVNYYNNSASNTPSNSTQPKTNTQLTGLNGTENPVWNYSLDNYLDTPDYKTAPVVM